MAKVFFHAHSHSELSPLDAISSVEGIVEKAARLGQPGLALTDHGNMAGSVQLYKAGKKHGVQVFPGVEAYLVEDCEDKKAQRYHIGMMSLNLHGYQSLVKLISRSHQRDRFQRFPRIDLSDLAILSAEAGNDIAVTTGCFFGLLQQTVTKRGEAEGRKVLEMYARWFPNLYVEIQNHNIDHSEQEALPKYVPQTDAEMCEVLFDMAQDMGLPVIATQDFHYLETKEKVAHNLLKKVAYRSTEDASFPGDSFHMSTAKWVREHHDPKHWRACLESYKDLLEKHDLSIPPLDKYKPQIPSTTKTPYEDIKRLCLKRLRTMLLRGELAPGYTFADYKKRLFHELHVIKTLGYAGYFTIFTKLVAWMREVLITFEARGSGNGSLVNFLLEITQADPLRRGLLFERFMSLDRKKPPDIDMDVEDERRGEVLQWLRENFDVTQIGTFSALGAKEDDDRGSVLVSYISYISQALGNEKYRKYWPYGIQNLTEIQNYSIEDYKAIRLLAKTRVRKSYGVHAGGVLMSGDDQKISDYVPTMLVASSNTTVSQFVMDDVEELGYTKLDILGQKTLSIMRRCQENIGRKNPRDFTWIPEEDEKTMRYLRTDRAFTGIFQFEGASTARGVSELRPRTLDDIVAAGALFRPACMDSGMTDLYLDRRRDASWESDVIYPHPIFKEVLRPTLGVVLFQEQVLEIMRGLGLSYEDINTFFKIVKDSGKGATDRNLERAAEVRTRWSDICKNAGIEDEDDAWHYIEGYTKYGFNKAHSAGYGIRTYRTAYLKTHYPTEFMAAVLAAWAGTANKTRDGEKKEEFYVREAKRMDLDLLPPDVNISQRTWTLDKDADGIRKGLLSVKGVGESLADLIVNFAPYDSLEELIEETNVDRCISGGKDFLKSGNYSGAIRSLYEANALESLGHPFQKGH